MIRGRALVTASAALSFALFPFSRSLEATALGGATSFFTLAPCRVIDTRLPTGPLGGPALVAGADRVFPVAGTCGIPTTAQAISVNVAVTQATAPGNIRLHPGGTAVPLISTINYSAGQTRSNNAIVPLNELGALAAYADTAAGNVHLILDVNGFFAPNDGSPLPTIEFLSAASSGSEATALANLAVGLSAASAGTVTVDYAVVGGTATGGGVDYTLAAGTLTFDPGDTLKYVPLVITDDCVAEPDETVVVLLSAPAGATLGAITIHTYTISDNDGIDLTSPVSSTSHDGTPLTACLTAGTGAKVLVWTELRHPSGTPATEAVVQIGGVAATPSTAQPGVYWREVTAAAAPGSQPLPVTATTCAGTVTLSNSVTITHVAANATMGGTGGCSPADGNLRVRVTTAETAVPLAGASVMVGLSQGTPFEHNPEALFGGPSTPASNVALTDGSGYATFYDYGSALAGPVTATAGAETRAYFMVADGNASDLVLPLPLLHPPAVPTTTYDNGTAASIPARPNCTFLQMGLVLPKLSLESFSSFREDSLFARRRCVDSGIAGQQLVPENIHIPSQTIGTTTFLCLASISAPWSLALKNTAATGTTENVEMVFGYAPVSTLLGGASFFAALNALQYQEIGFIRDETVPTPPTSGRGVTLDSTYPVTLTVNFAGTPAQTDVLGLTAADYSGGNGTGSLGLLAANVHAYSDAGSAVVIRNSGLGGLTAPPGVRRLASVVALYLEPLAPRVVPANRAAAMSSVLLRDDGAGGAPFGGGANAVLSATDFLGLAGTTFTGPGGFAWEDARANGNAPLYSVHELALRKRLYLPVVSCATQNEVREESSVQWVVMRPFAANCPLGQECFTLPTLPPSFPRAGSGVQQKSGFEQKVGSGVACVVPADCTVLGEACVDPDGAGTAGKMCMSGSGTAGDPYVIEDYVWRLHLYDLGLAPSFDFNGFQFSQRRQWMTHESSNTQVFN
jgi:Calx-beta domain